MSDSESDSDFSDSDTDSSEDVEIDRNQSIVFPSLKQLFPPPSIYEYFDARVRNPVTLRAFRSAPWYEKRVCNTGLYAIVAYCFGNELLQGHISLGALGTWCWQRKFSINDEDHLRVDSRRMLAAVREDFVNNVKGGLFRMFETDLINLSLRFLAFFHRTKRALESRCLSNIDASLIASWDVKDMVAQEAFCYTMPLLHLDFR